MQKSRLDFTDDKEFEKYLRVYFFHTILKEQLANGVSNFTDLVQNCYSQAEEAVAYLKTKHDTA